MKPGPIEPRRVLFSMRNFLATLPLIYAIFSHRWTTENQLIIWPAALLLASAGTFIRAWASVHCSYSQRRERELTTGGPYRFVRHPLYIGNILIFGAAAMISGLAWLTPIAMLWAWGVYAAIVGIHEEPLALRWFGEPYRQYRERVRAWLPSPTALADLGLPSATAIADQSLRLVFIVPLGMREEILRVLGRH